ncbi:MAG: hypothetical protein ABI680_11110 [Chthoniobacteraceae bacterium]
MKTKLILILALAALVVTAAAIYVAKRQQSAAHETREAELARQRAAEEYHDARKKTGEFLVPDTGNDILRDIKNRPGHSATPAPATPYAP